MNTLIAIALTTQPLKARHSPTVEPLCFSWERSCVQTAPHTPGNAHARKQKNHHDFTTHFGPTYPRPSRKHARSASHSALLWNGHTHIPPSPPTPPRHIVPAPRSDFTAQTVSLCLLLLFPFSPSPFLSVFMDQRREQLHQRRSGGLEMKSCVAVGKHLATVRGAEQEE